MPRTGAVFAAGAALLPLLPLLLALLALLLTIAPLPAAAQNVEVLCGNSSTTATLRLQSDIEAIANCTTFEGSILISTANISRVELPVLSLLSGNLTVDSADLLELGLPSLELVKGSLVLSGAKKLARFTMDKCTQIDGSLIVNGTALKTLANNVEVLKGELVVANNSYLEEIHEYRLAQDPIIYIVGNPVLTTLSFPQLLRMQSLYMGDDAWINDMSSSFPVLQTVEGSLLMYLDNITYYQFPGLLTVGGDLKIHGLAISCSSAKSEKMQSIVVKGITSLQCGTGEVYQRETLDYTWIFGIVAGLIFLGVVLFFTPNIYHKMMARYQHGRGGRHFADPNDDSVRLNVPDEHREEVAMH